MQKSRTSKLWSSKEVRLIFQVWRHVLQWDHSMLLSCLINKSSLIGSFLNSQHTRLNQKYTKASWWKSMKLQMSAAKHTVVERVTVNQIPVNGALMKRCHQILENSSSRTIMNAWRTVFSKNYLTNKMQKDKLWNKKEEKKRKQEEKQKRKERELKLNKTTQRTTVQNSLSMLITKAECTNTVCPLPNMNRNIGPLMVLAWTT